MSGGDDNFSFLFLFYGNFYWNKHNITRYLKMRKIIDTFRSNLGKLLRVDLNLLMMGSDNLENNGEENGDKLIGYK